MANLLTVKADPATGIPFIPRIDISPSFPKESSSYCHTTTTPPPLFTGPPQGNVRRSRYNFSTDAIRALEDEFLANPYPDHARRETLSNQLRVSEARIHTWFTNKRARTKKVIRKKDHSPAATSSEASSTSSSSSSDKQLPVYVPARKRSREPTTTPAKKRQCTSPVSSASSFLMSPLHSTSSLFPSPVTASAFLPYHFASMYYPGGCLPVTSSPLLSPQFTPYWMLPSAHITPTAAPSGRCSPHPIGFLPKDSSQRSALGSDSGYISHEED